MIWNRPQQATIDAAEAAPEDEAGVSTDQPGADFCRFEAICDEAEPTPETTIDAAEPAPEDEAGLSTDQPGADLCRFEAICDETEPAPETPIDAAEPALRRMRRGCRPTSPAPISVGSKPFAMNWRLSWTATIRTSPAWESSTLRSRRFTASRDGSIMRPRPAGVAEDRFAEATDRQTADARVGNDVPGAEPTRVAGPSHRLPAAPSCGILQSAPVVRGSTSISVGSKPFPTMRSRSMT